MSYIEEVYEPEEIEIVLKKSINRTLQNAVAAVYAVNHKK